MKLTDSQIEHGLSELPGWSRAGDAITKQFVFAGFPDSMAFTIRLAFDAEAADHHPDITINYRKVTLRYSTHSEGGITQKDLDGARMAEERALPS